MVSAFGTDTVQGQDFIVHVTVIVPAGESADAAVDRALKRIGAARLGSAAYVVNADPWAQFSDADPLNDFVTQHYNPGGDPTGGGLAALLAAHTT